MNYAIAAAALGLALLPASPVLAQAVDIPTATTTQVSPIIVNPKQVWSGWPTDAGRDSVP